MTGRFLKGLRAVRFWSIAIVVLAGVVLAGGCNHRRATPEDTTAVANEVSQTLVGRQITIRGKFASLTKGDPYVVLDNQQDVWIGPRETAMFDQGERIGEDQHGVVEADAVLAFVGFGLGVVPLEPDHTKYNSRNVVTQV